MIDDFTEAGLAISADGPIRVMTIDRPQSANSVDAQLHRALGQVWDALAEDPDARAVVLTGAGRAFCAGGDRELITRAAHDPQWRYDLMRHARRIVDEMLRFPLPVVAAVNGPAIGLGASIVTLSDVVVIDETAYLADPHVPLGLVAADGGALVWPALIGAQRAKNYLFTGQRIDASTAVQLGLATQVAPAGASLPEALAVARALADLPRQALADTKRALNIHLRRAVESVIDFAFSSESETFAALTRGDEPGRT